MPWGGVGFCVDEAIHERRRGCDTRRQYARLYHGLVDDAGAVLIEYVNDGYYTPTE